MDYMLNLRMKVIYAKNKVIDKIYKRVDYQTLMYTEEKYFFITEGTGCTSF